MYTVDDYISTIRKNLEKQNDQVTANLQALFKRTFADEIDLLDFMAFIEPTRFECGISVFSMDRYANEVLSCSASAAHFYGSQEVLKDTEYFHLPDSRRDEFDQFYMENEEVIMPLELKVLTDWFQDNWERADGRSLSLPSYFGLHDGYSSYDLKQERWIDDEQKWR
ncbi:hypothetical protein JMA_03100 [Jeotgalibacillus malaysiensis]|uniref:Uncharacterized protein n=1 Tax=Jeotgalibacillus malaysiensis TaxID=1508404 RepID=A0A0B5ALQ4_9BACL|nr:hypothetical protein [Jeotgalibacillus malaysiensis]AJD89627.1 hypothetical protein JMA_03100 [Jeotgalibacillus malaysiensis]